MEEKIHKGEKVVNQVEKNSNLKEMITKTAEKYGEKTVFKLKTDKKNEYKEISYKEFANEVNALGTALISVGLKDKRIAVIGENRYEWGLAYLSIVCGTGLVVPLDKSLPENEIQSLIERAEVEAIFYTSKYDDVMKKIKEANSTNLKFFISMDKEESENEIYSQKELIKIGNDLLRNGAKTFLDAKINSEEMSIMLFTSGTTSQSKAVSLSHNNICSNIYDIASGFDIGSEDTLLSFLPLHHTFESTVGFLYPISVGATIVFCEGIRHIADNIKEYQVTAMVSVPILFESMYKRLMKSIEKKGKLKTVKKGIKISNFLLKFGIDIRRKIFKEIHENLGGKLRIFVNGAAAIDPEVIKGFNELGIKLVQGYGLTETSPVIAAEYDKNIRVGSVGKVLPSLEVKIVDPNEEGIGEIAVRGSSVMLGYYENEEATKETIQDGWLYTGDLGYFDKDEFLYIAGRKKSVIVLKNGKNIYPEEVENVINKIDGVKESMVYGKPEDGDENDLKLCAKIVYDKDEFKEIFNETEEEKIKEIIWNQIKLINKEMPPYKYIREIIVTTEELIKTTTQKIKRHEEMKKIDKIL